MATRATKAGNTRLTKAAATRITKGELPLTPGRLFPDADIDTGAWVGEDASTSENYLHAGGAGTLHTLSHRLPKRRANVVYVMQDDERMDWVGGVDNRQVQDRPGILAMIASGTICRNAFGNINACAPSRASVESGLASWNDHLSNETDIDLYDWTKTIFKDAWGTVGARLTQTAFFGKLVNEWGHPGGKLPLPGAFTGMMPCFDEAYIFYTDGAGHSEQQKGNFASYEFRGDQDGNALGGYPSTFISNYNKGLPATFDEYATDYIRVNALGFIQRACNRPIGDSRKGLPFAVFISNIAGHTPFQDPPVYTPDLTNRATRMALYDNNWTRDLYDTRTAATGDLGCTPPAPGFSHAGHVATTAWNGIVYPSITTAGQTWTEDQWVRGKVTLGASFGVVVHNTADTLVIGEWLAVGSQDAHFSYSLGSIPADGTYTYVIACADIDQTNAGGSGDNATQLQGASGPFSASPGNNVKDERRTGKELVAVDDQVQAIRDYLATQSGQYSLDNTVFVYTADNSIVRGEKDVWVDKGYPMRNNFLIPMIFSGAGISAGAKVDTPVCTWDIYPTLMSFLGVPTSARSRPVSDGLDLSRCLRGQDPWPNGRAIIFNLSRPSTGTTRGVTTGTGWRYVHDSTPPTGIPNDMIFNSVRDPLELRNLWTDSEVTSGSPSIRDDLVAMATAHDGNQSPAAAAANPPGTVAALTYAR